MLYELREYDGKYFCNSIRISSNGLIQWESSGNVDTMIVCMPIGMVDIRKVPDFCDKLVKQLNRYGDNISHMVYTEIGNGIYVKILNPSEKARSNGTQMYIPGRGYMVLAVKENEDGMCLYMSACDDYSVYKESELHIEVAVTEEKRGKAVRSGLFGRGKSTNDSQYYKITFRPDFAGGYVDGLIYYQIGKYKIPITQQMIDHREIYVNKVTPDMPKPRVESISSQVKIVGR